MTGSDPRQTTHTPRVTSINVILTVSNDRFITSYRVQVKSTLWSTTSGYSNMVFYRCMYVYVYG